MFANWAAAGRGLAQVGDKAQRSCEDTMSRGVSHDFYIYIWFIYSLLKVRYKCAKFHHCRILVTDFRGVNLERAYFPPFSIIILMYFVHTFPMELGTFPKVFSSLKRYHIRFFENNIVYSCVWSTSVNMFSASWGRLPSLWRKWYFFRGVLSNTEISLTEVEPNAMSSLLFKDIFSSVSFQNGLCYTYLNHSRNSCRICFS